MQEHQLGHRGDVGRRVAQRLHPTPRHPRPDDVVVVERRALARLETSCAGLADVVEQRGEAGDAEVVAAAGQLRRHVLDDGDGVAEHVLVAMDRVVLEPQCRQLGQEVLGEPGVDEEPQPGRRCVDDDQLVQLVADPLGRHDLESRSPVDDGGDELGHGRQAVAGDEPGRPQHAQRIVVEAHLRRQWRAQRPCRQIGGAAVGIDQRHVDAALAGSSSRAMALIVKSRRARSDSMSSANVTCGLRDSSV